MSFSPEELVALRRALGHTEPLGSIQQELIDDIATRQLLDDQVIPFRGATTRPYMLLLGRKGAGKSSMLAEIRLRLGDGRRLLSIA
jgi:hypothetical protein